MNWTRNWKSEGIDLCGYADDYVILCKSKRSAERTLARIITFIEGKLFLKVNREKTSVAHISKVKYLGYGFTDIKENVGSRYTENRK